MCSYRIAFVNSATSWGGNEKWAVDASAGLMERGHDVCFVYRHDCVGQRIRKIGMEGVRLPFANDADLSSAFRLFRLSRGCDAMVLTKQREYLLGGVAGRAAGRAAILLRLGIVRELAGAKQRIVFGSLADRVIVNSRAVRDALVRLSWLEERRIALVYNGIRVDWARAGNGGFRREFGIDEGDPLMVGIGRVCPQKRFDLLLRAHALVLRRLPRVKLAIIGQGDQLEELKEMARRLSIESSVVFPGFRLDIPSILADSDLFVLSSAVEGMPNVLLEAMLSRVPSVAFAVSGVPEILRHGETGLLVDFGNVDGLAEATILLLEDNSLAAHLGDAGFNRVIRDFSFDRMIDELEAVIVDAIRGRRRDSVRNDR